MEASQMGLKSFLTKYPHLPFRSLILSPHPFSEVTTVITSASPSRRFYAFRYLSIYRYPQEVSKFVRFLST